MGKKRERALDHLLRDSRIFDDFDKLALQVGEERANALGVEWINRREDLLGDV